MEETTYCVRQGRERAIPPAKVDAAAPIGRSRPPDRDGTFFHLWGGAGPARTAGSWQVDVFPDSNADKNGIEKGDYLLSYEGQRPDSITGLLEMIEAVKAAGKKEFEVVVYRGSNRLILELKPGRRGSC